MPEALSRRPSDGPAIVSETDANLSSRESGAAAGPVSSVESSYSSLHQSSS
ncbi:hypothetical protein [Streptomyces sp. NPDC047725]|uniref:hypothetical protein n=1 Tax=Streptomyces sp. NPDC047725 TaxID=3365487 RepID=UPI00371CB48A